VTDVSFELIMQLKNSNVILQTQKKDASKDYLQFTLDTKQDQRKRTSLHASVNGDVVVSQTNHRMSNRVFWQNLKLLHCTSIYTFYAQP